MNGTVDLTDLQLWLLIIGFVGPLVISFVSRPTLAPWAKIAIQVVYSAIAGAGTAYLSGQFDGRTVISSVLLVLAVTVLSYKGLWKPTGVSDSIESGVLAGEVDLAVPTSDSSAADDLPDAEDVDPQDIVDFDDAQR